MILKKLKTKIESFGRDAWWILPNGEVKKIDPKGHGEFIENNPELFGLKGASKIKRLRTSNPDRSGFVDLVIDLVNDVLRDGAIRVLERDGLNVSIIDPSREALKSFQNLLSRFDRDASVQLSTGSDQVETFVRQLLNLKPRKKAFKQLDKNQPRTLCMHQGSIDIKKALESISSTEIKNANTFLELLHKKPPVGLSVSFDTDAKGKYIYVSENDINNIPVDGVVEEKEKFNVLIREEPLDLDQMKEYGLSPTGLYESSNLQLINKHLVPILERERVIAFSQRNGDRLRLITDSSKYEGWQLTRFDKSGPLGDVQYEKAWKVISNAISRDGPWELLTQEQADDIILNQQDFIVNDF